MFADRKLTIAFVATLLILAVVSVLNGFCHTILCAWFFNSAIGFWNAFILIIFTIYLIRIRFFQPGTVFLFVLVLSLTSFAMIGIGLLSFLFDLLPNLPVLSYIRVHLLGRTSHSEALCLNFFSNVTAPLDRMSRDLLSKASYAVYCGLGIVQLIVTLLINWNIKRWYVWEPELPHVHVVLGFISIIVGSVHLSYCCRYYYLP